MANPPPYPGIPRWVKVSGVIVIVLPLLFIGLHLITNTRFGGPAGHALPSSVTEHSVRQP